jgi:hypothetical protein
MKTTQHNLHHPLLAICLLLATAANADPLAIRDQTPLTRAQYLPAGAATTSDNAWQLDAQLAWSNTVNVGATTQERLVVDEESTELTLSASRRVGAWQLRASVPVVQRSAGVLDGFIDGWHRAFGLPQGARPTVPRNAYALTYQRLGSAPVLVASGAALGDLQLEAGRTLIASSQTKLQAWAGVELPTGDSTKLMGNGAVDAAAWLTWQHTLAPRWTMDARAGYSRSGGDGLLPLERNVGFGSATLSWRSTQQLEALLQVDAHSALLRGSALPMLREAVQLTIGGRWHLQSGSVFEASVVEDIQVNHSPDVSFQFGWRWAR